MELVAKVGPQKMDFVPPPSDGLFDVLRERYFDRLKSAKQADTKAMRAEQSRNLREEALAELIPNPEAEGAYQTGSFFKSWHDLEEKAVRELILSGKRSDGRDNRSLRNIECEVDLLPCVHGSALFQ